MRSANPRQPDAELVRAARQGAREALAELVTRHWDTAVFLAARVLGSPELARDAAQEAAIAAMTDLGRLRAPDRFGAWFCGIALNVARRWVRQHRPEITGLPADQASAEPGPAEAAEIADLAGRVRAAIAALPSGQRKAVLLFYLEGLSHREVAAELAISVGAVKSRLHQARASLAPVLAPMLQIPEKEKAMPGTAGTGTTGTDWAEVSVTEVRCGDDDDLLRRQYVMILTERHGTRQLPILIGPAEATALALALESAQTPRPFTYKLAAGLVAAAGSRLSEIRITRLTDYVFYASVIVQGPAGPQEVDARPSDAVNLAVVAEAPIRVDTQLLRQVPAPAGRLGALPLTTAQIAAQAQERQQRMRERLREEGETASGSP